MKSDKRKKQSAAKKAAKAAAIRKPGGKSAYAQKEAEQKNGHYRKTSPFYMSEGG